MRFAGRTRKTIVTGAGLAFGVAMAAPAHAATWAVVHPQIQQLSTVPYAPLASVSANAANNAWAVGRDDGSALLEHWNGAKWTASALPAGGCNASDSSCELTGVSVDPTGGAIAVGNGILDAGAWVPTPLAYQWSGSAWRTLPLPSTIPYLSLAHVKAFSPSNAWAVGTATDSAGTVSTPVVTHWNGTSWTQSPTPYTTTLSLTMNAVSGSSPSDVWIAGKAQTRAYRAHVAHSVLEHFDGRAWSQVAVPDDTGLVDLAALSATDAWALTADGVVLHWNGTAWTAATRFVGGTALAAASPTNVWVGGIIVNGKLSLAHYNGTTWTTSSAPAGIDLMTSGAAVSGSVWFAGLQWPPDATTMPALLLSTG